MMTSFGPSVFAAVAMAGVAHVSVDAQRGGPPSNAAVRPLDNVHPGTRYRGHLTFPRDEAAGKALDDQTLFANRGFGMVRV